jgi:predicted hotdog family 3-hydroxylacyl-ACP dehydratase
MKNFALSDITLEDLLPHRGPMLLISEVLDVGETHSITLCRVEKSWPMAESGGVCAIILVELAAQSAGVCNGLDRVKKKGIDSERMGWLVGVKSAEFFIDTLPFGSNIRCHSKNLYSFASLREVSCEQHIGDKMVGKMTLQLFQEETT